MIGSILYAALPRMAEIAVVVAVALIFYSAGHKSAELDCINERMRFQHEAQTAISEADAQQKAMAADLEESRYQIEVMHDQAQDEITAALDRNRELVQRLRQQPARADTCAIRPPAKAARRAEHETAAARLVPAGIQPLPAEFAAECDRALSVAHAGQAWARSIDTTVRDSHVGN